MLCLDGFLNVVKLSLPRGAIGLCVTSDCGIKCEHYNTDALTGQDIL